MATSSKKQRLMSETPRELNLLEYVGERVTEIADLLQVVDNHDLPAGEVTQGPRTVLQRLPRHMRRRAMSYNVKRLPRSQRVYGLSAIAKTSHRAKPPSRFHRRRARNLLNAYIRRQRRNAWLETHIWHAKRFLMRDVWGYRLAESSYQRGFRPAYRDSVRHCLVRDISYMRCLQLSGGEQELIHRLGHLCAKQLGPTVAFRAALDGRTELSLMLYRKDCYPLDCIGPVRLLWMPRSDNETDERTMWIWVHPSSANELLNELVALFRLHKDSRPDQTSSGEQTTPCSSLDAHKLNAMETTTDQYSSEEDGGVSLVDLRDQLVRIRLSGRLSNSVLAQMLRLVDVQDSALTDGRHATYSSHHLHWERVTSRQMPGELRDGLVTSLLIEDPRLSRPPRKGLCRQVQPPSGIDAANAIPDAAIWSSSIRRQLLCSKLAESALQKLRADSTAAVIATEAKIPVLVIVRNGGANLGAGADLIAPGGFGMPLWVALQYGTARAGGLREERTCAFESSQLAFPDDLPDCAAGVAAVAAEAAECEDKHSRRPHNRRVLYWSKLRIKYPFSFSWKELVDGWTKLDDSFYVLRDRAALGAIALWVQGKGAPPTDLLQTHRRALVAVSVHCAARGCPKRRALICLPTGDDLSTQRTDDRRRIVECGDVTTTTPQSLANKEQPTKRADAPLDDFVSLDNETEVSMQTLFPDKDAEKAAHSKAKEKQRKQKRKNKGKCIEPTAAPWSAETNVVDSCARQVIGFVVRGGFSFAVGHGTALGYCSLAALEQVGGARVLFRNTTSKHYHFAKLSVMKLSVNI